jgi:membrane protein implicated in regulation of membrane protease activity
MVRARSQGIPNLYPALYSLGFTILMVLFTIGTADHHVWVLTVIFAIASLISAYFTFTWVRGWTRRRAASRAHQGARRTG